MNLNQEIQMAKRSRTDADAAECDRLRTQNAELLAALQSLCWYGSSATAGGLCVYCNNRELHHEDEDDCPIIIGRAAIANATQEATHAIR